MRGVEALIGGDLRVTGVKGGERDKIRWCVEAGNCISELVVFCVNIEGSERECWMGDKQRAQN